MGIRIELRLSTKIISCMCPDLVSADYLLRLHRGNGDHPDGIGDDGGVTDPNGRWHPNNMKSRTWDEYLTQAGISHRVEYIN